MNLSGPRFTDRTEADIADIVMAWNFLMSHKQPQRASASVFAKVERAKREWEATADSLSELVCLVDQQGRVMRANRIVEAWQLGRVEEVQGGDLHTLLHPGCSNADCAFSRALARALEQARIGQSAEWDTDDPILQRFVHVCVRPVIDQDYDLPPTSVVVVYDITQSKLVENTLRVTADELQARNDDLSAYAHTVAHDLKNPLGNLLLHLDLMQDAQVALPAEELAQRIEAMARIGQKMVNIVDELLLLAEVRQADVALAPLDMGSIVDGALQRLAGDITQAGAEISLPSAWPVAMGYGPWIEEVWANYLSNALKYGGRRPVIALGATGPSHGLARFWVRDYGPGIPLEEKANVFVPFARLSRTQPSGHGLGLSIVKRIVEKLNGTVDVESEGVPGAGSEFSFSLPAATAA